MNIHLNLTNMTVFGWYLQLGDESITISIEEKNPEHR